MPKITSDIAVIEAGITGAAAAVFLACAGLKVVLLEKGRFGAEASERCAGDGAANPLLTMQALGGAALKNGVNVKVQEPAATMKVQNSRVVSACTAKAEYQADSFIVAIGPWTGRLLKPLGLELLFQRRLSGLMITEAIQLASF